jgi:hypothetical protein
MRLCKPPQLYSGSCTCYSHVNLSKHHSSVMKIEYEEAPGDSAGAVVDDADDRAARKAAFLEQMKKKRAQARLVDGVKTFGGPVVKAQMPKALVDSKGEFNGIDELISALPSNYSFEVKKSVWRLLESKCAVVALQFPEGLLV